MRKRQGSARKWVYICFAVSILSALVLWSCRLWMAWEYPSAQMVSGSVGWLLLLLMILPLVAAVFLIAKRGAIGLGPLYLASAVVLLAIVTALIPVFRYQDRGSLAETIEKRVSAQATVKRATLMYRNGDYSLDEQQLDQLRELCQSIQVSTCLPISALRSEPVGAGRPSLMLIMDNPADTSQTYGIDIVFYQENLAHLRFFQSSGPDLNLLYAIEGEALYQLMQENLENLQYPEA